MKKVFVFLLCVLLLTGCGGKETLETVADIQTAPVMAAAQRIQVQLPPELSTPVLQSEQTGTLYLCDDYSVTVQTVESGDLNKTIRNATGIKKEELQILQTQKDNVKCYQWVWTANGESGIQVGRGCILDDGVYHYVLTALADESSAGKVRPVWQEIFSSYCLATEREPVSTGS